MKLRSKSRLLMAVAWFLVMAFAALKGEFWFALWAFVLGALYALGVYRRDLQRKPDPSMLEDHPPRPPGDA